jgi:glycosyltransferase involved in cell wall biosynthesis
MSEYLRYYMKIGDYNLWKNGDYLYLFKLASHKWAQQMQNPENIGLAMIDDVLYFESLVRKLKKCGIPLVVFQQNMESLVPGQPEEGRQRDLFNKELDLLSFCDLVVTISREEAFLLNNLGINAVFFPYYPVDAIVNRMLDVREDRKGKEKEDIILLGTAGNKPTELGMAKVIKTWKEQGFARLGLKLLVAGYGTDVLKDVALGDGVEFLGSLTDEELVWWLSTVKACLCYQERGCGALTRISEMLVAGVPVLANTHAARSFYNLKGVVEFSSLGDFEDAILTAGSLDGSIPVPSPPDLTFLKSEVKRLLT